MRRRALWRGEGPIPVGTEGVVTGWDLSGKDWYYFVEFGPDDGGGR